MDEWRSNCDIPTAEYPENKADLDINDGEEPPKAAAQQLSHKESEQEAKPFHCACGHRDICFGISFFLNRDRSDPIGCKKSQLSHMSLFYIWR